MERQTSVEREREYKEYLRVKDEVDSVLQRLALPEVSKRINRIVNEESFPRRYGLFSTEVENTEGLGDYRVDPTSQETQVLCSLKNVEKRKAKGQTVVDVPRQFLSFSRDWSLRYDREEKSELMYSSIKKVAADIARFEEEFMWRILYTAATTKGAKNICYMSTGSSTFVTKVTDLIIQMRRKANDMGLELTTLLLPQQELYLLKFGFGDKLDLIRDTRESDVGSMHFSQNDDEMKEAINFSVDYITTEEEGKVYPYFIYGNGSQIRDNSSSTVTLPPLFCGDEETNSFNDYKITNPFLVKKAKYAYETNVHIPGEIQIIGLCDKPLDYLKMPVFNPYMAYFDFNLVRKYRSGFYGSYEVGMACLNPNKVIMGVVDRSI